jgi:SPP1 family predicted phage head-tail adaptor
MAYWKNVAYLIRVKTVLDAARRPQKKDAGRTLIYCNKKSVRQSEFYQAGAQGKKPEIMLEVRPANYHDEEFIELQGVRYHVDRTYQKNDDVMELVLSRQVVGHG